MTTQPKSNRPSMWATLDALWARGLVLPLKAYRLLLSPWLGNACRFEPSCSRYAIEALQTHGGMRGSYLMARRVLRCHPGCETGHDPVPPMRQRGRATDATATANTTAKTTANTTPTVASTAPPLNAFTE
jgi:uncharacterized protein